MRSKSESCEIRAEEIELQNKADQDFFGLVRSIDSKCVGRIIVEGLGEEISAERRNG
jgi:hypothetical protein